MRVVDLELDQVELVGKVLGKAFQNDPPTIYIFPDPERRLPLLTTMFTELTRSAPEKGGGGFTLESPVAAAVWYRIDQPKTEDKDEHVPDFVSAWRPDELQRARNFFSVLQSAHARLMPEPHGYLNFIGVDPDHQGQGHGSTLIQAVIEHFRAQNLPCYLETATERNVPLYKRHGFQVVEENVVPDTSIRIWAFRRDP